jgi:putative endonuclease
LFNWNPFAPRKIAASRLGRRGESRAAWFYRLRGYRIMARNLRLREGEIDLVARRGRTIAIVEVKTRQSLGTGEGYEAVDQQKRLRLVQLGDRYAAQSPRGTMLRYDILSLFWNGRRFVVTHFPDAFRPVSDPVRPWKWRV